MLNGRTHYFLLGRNRNVKINELTTPTTIMSIIADPFNGDFIKNLVTMDRAKKETKKTTMFFIRNRLVAESMLQFN